LSEVEFTSLIKEFTQNLWNVTDFQTLPPILTDFFSQRSNSSCDRTIDVSDDTTIQLFGEGIESAVRESQRAKVSADECVDMLIKADVDEDERLSQAEYAPLAVNLAFPGLSGAQLGSVQYDELDQNLKLAFGLLTGLEETVDMAGLRSSDPTVDQSNRLKEICRAIEEKVTSGLSNSTTAVYNSFIILNEKGLNATDLRTDPYKSVLDRAYSAFADDQAFKFRVAGGTRRHLAIIGSSPSSGQINSLNTTECTGLGNLTGNESCHVAFASFDLILLNEASPEALSESLS
jgi:hypothetical protein